MAPVRALSALNGRDSRFQPASGSRTDLPTGCEVWNTEYTEDTRTLDVHISWLREILEENPRKPQYLKTIRGLGYRLDVCILPN